MDQNNTILAQKFSLRFYSLSNNSFGFNLSFPRDNMEIFDFISGITNIFSTPSKSDTVNFNCTQIMSKELRSNIVSHFQMYTNARPELNQIIKKINEIPDNEYFLVFPYETGNSLKEDHHWQSVLHALNTTNNKEEFIKSMDSQNEMFEEIYGTVSDSYHIHIFGESRRKKIIGIKPTHEFGKCRFCKKCVADGATFRKLAHSISEALGNKSIVTADECDECNSKFGSTVEPHLIRYLDLFRVFFAISGKNGVPELKFKDNGSFLYRNQQSTDLTENTMVMSSQNITENDTTISILQESFDKINQQKIFKSLCKMALSVLDSSEIENFNSTIEWLLSEPVIGEEQPSLSIAKLIFTNFTKHPILKIFVKKNMKETSIPHLVAELHFGSLMFIYIVPFSEKDQKHFTIADDFPTLTQVFTHYGTVKNQISFEDLSSTQDKQLQFKVNFIKPK